MSELKWPVKKVSPQDVLSAAPVNEHTDGLVGVIEAVGAEEFGERLLAFVNESVPVDSGLVVAYPHHRRPMVICDALAHALRENTVAHYLAGAYLLDPFYIRAIRHKAPSLKRMADIAPKDFLTSEYFVHYYKHSGVVDEVNFLTPADRHTTLAACIERSRASTPFSATEIEQLQTLEPVVTALMRAHWRFGARPDEELPADDEHMRLEAALKSFGASQLTPREREVAQLMLQGYSAPGAAELLGLSVETIRVHRRNIYDKLEISSLQELFSLALRTLSQSATSIVVPSVP